MRVAIIGGGAAGASLTGGLVRSMSNCSADETPISITVYEPNEKVGPGQAYQADTVSAKLNRQAGQMSVQADNPGDFVSWMFRDKASQHIDPRLANDFLPREVFGKYLNERFNEYVQQAKKKGATVSVVQDIAFDIDRDMRSNQWIVSTKNKESQKFDKIIFCPGTGRPTNPYNLEKDDSYIDNPYPLGRSLRIHPRHEPIVLGTGLSAIDVYRFLRENKHQGKITLASRRALLPSIRHPDIEITPKHFTVENLQAIVENKKELSLKDIFDLAKKEFDEHKIPLKDVQEILFSKKSPEKKLAYKLGEIEKKNIAEPLLNIMARHTTEFIWHHLNEKDRLRFLEKYHPIFNSIRNPMPPATAKMLLSDMQNGSLQVRDGIQNVQRGDNGKYIISFLDGDQLVDTAVLSRWD